MATISTDYFNALVANAARAYCDIRRQDSPSAAIEIVEVGAGTGATTAKVLDALGKGGHRVNYTFTDVSSGFMHHAEARFAQRYPNVRFRTLDIESDVEAQGFTRDSVDLVIATNVLHATRDLRMTLRRVKQLLTRHGWLLLNELTEVRSAITIMGGVLDGWWLYRDAAERLPDAPLAGAAAWERLLGQEGFGRPAVLGRPGAPGWQYGQNVFVAENDGHVRMARAANDVAFVRPVTAIAPPPAPPRDEDVLSRVRRIVTESLKISEALDDDRELYHYGFDSLTGIKVVNRLKEAYGDLSIREVLDQPTVRRLAAYLIERTAPASSVETPVPVAADERIETYSLSEGQRALWTYARLRPESYAYNVPLGLWIRPDADLDRLERALQQVLARHQMLRVTFSEQDGQPVQTVGPNRHVPLRRIDLTGLDAAASRRAIDAETEALFDLRRGPGVRFAALEMGDGRRLLLVTCHHILVDGVSLRVITEDIEVCYANPSAPLRRQDGQAGSYGAFVAVEASLLAGPIGEDHRSYWLDRLRDLPPALAMPTRGTRTPTPSFRGERIEALCDAALTAELRAVASRLGVTPYTLMLSAFTVLLYRYTRQTDLVVLTPVSVRPYEGFDDVVGYFVNMVPVRTALAGDVAFGTLAKQVRDSSLAAIEHSAFPLSRLLGELRAAGVSHAASLLDVTFYYQNWLANTAEGGAQGLISGPSKDVFQKGEFELSLEVVESDAACELYFKFNPDVYAEPVIRRMAAHYLAILREAAAEPNRQIDGFSLLSDAERRRLDEWNDGTHADMPDRRVHELFEEQSRRTPDAIAVTDGLRTLTYRELDERAAMLAQYLAGRGIGPGLVVAVFLDRNVDLVVGLLGVLKAGGAYLPLDPESPRDRLAYMLDHARARLMLCHAGMAARLPEACPPLVQMDRDWPVIAAAGTGNVSGPIARVGSDDSNT